MADGKPSIARLIGIVLAASTFALWLGAFLSVPVPEGHGKSAPPPEMDNFIGYWIAAVAAAVAARLYWHPYRVLGTVPYLATGWFALCLLSYATGVWPGWAHGIFAGALVGAGLRSVVVTRSPWHYVAAIGGLLAGPTLLALTRAGMSRPEEQRFLALVLAAVTGLLAVLAWLRLFRPAFELFVEPVLWRMYHVRAAGPGMSDFPVRGACLVVVNHACWLDPIFLSKVLPRPITPMMTSRFYDKPGIRFLMRAFGVIRVPEEAMRREAPEIQLAIAALDRGECVVLFPEGFLRRTEEKPLRRFGQGIWQIVRARPGTPVYAAWIEGGWGSYCSYFGGKPTQNKKPDRRRPIGVGVAAPVVIDPATLANHLPTRLALMNRVADARTHLGLPALTHFDLPKAGEVDAEGEKE